MKGSLPSGCDPLSTLFWPKVEDALEPLFSVRPEKHEEPDESEIDQVKGTSLSLFIPPFAGKREGWGTRVEVQDQFAAKRAALQGMATVPACSLLVGVGEAEHFGFTAKRPRDLQADGQSCASKATGNGDGG